LTAIYQPLDDSIVAALKLKFKHYLMDFVLQELEIERFSFGLITVGKSAK
jgi:hypothetical protein